MISKSVSRFWLLYSYIHYIYNEEMVLNNTPHIRHIIFICIQAVPVATSHRDYDVNY